MKFKIQDIVGERILWPYRLSVAEKPYACRDMITRAAWCNQYAMENADEIVIGALNPQGLLAFQLSDLPKNKPVIVWR